MSDHVQDNPFKPFIVVIVLMALTSIALAITVDPNITGEAGIKPWMPDRAGDWVGDELRFCHSRTCRSSFLLKDMTDPEVCEKCGEYAGPSTIAENDLLPKDTLIIKKRYTHPTEGRGVSVSLVLSSKERASIHRPEVCLRGQGNEIVGSQVISAPLEGRDPIDLKILDMIHRRESAEGKVLSEFHSYYAYWFVGKGRETPSHYWRMFWMASDRIFFNVAHQWAYISFSGRRDPGSDDYHDEIRSFVQSVYPEMILE